MTRDDLLAIRIRVLDKPSNEFGFYPTQAEIESAQLAFKDRAALLQHIDDICTELERLGFLIRVGER